MANPVTIEELSEAMYRMVKEATGVKKLKPTDLTKAMMEHFGPERCSKEACKEALRRLMDSGRCVYTYYGGSFVELPPEEGTEI
ncbi:MAG: hypothetical protein HYY65_01365 [Candidatus Tectomicrobia bacterium]|uniref:DsrD n=1 Tax=Tectimicrobiota bacterium TaxID=2528274 RepID=A0A932GMI2_UNCTE|nr:hypothetical protein [Candidatus Tectomicrobia bacterium]